MIGRGKSCSIITDYLGTPVEMYDEKGKLTWQAELDIYGKVRSFEGSSLNACLFRYQGQYEDIETGLYYNRFRYYSPSEGMYISQDPIGLEGNNPTLYGYVHDSNRWVDFVGLLNIALGIEDYLDDFAEQVGGETWKQWAKDNPTDWKNILSDLGGDPNNKVFFNLEGIDSPWAAIGRASQGAGGATDWELLQIYQNKFGDVTFFENGQIVPSPFCK